jgi:hypothetical protein
MGYAPAVSTTEHLTQLAAQEWARGGSTHLHKEDDAALALHLNACEACRRRVQDYRNLDLLMHPYGTQAPPAPRFAFWCKVAFIVSLILVFGYLLWRLTGM